MLISSRKKHFSSRNQLPGESIRKFIRPLFELAEHWILIKTTKSETNYLLEYETGNCPKGRN